MPEPRALPVMRRLAALTRLPRPRRRCRCFCGARVHDLPAHQRIYHIPAELTQHKEMRR